MLVLSEESDGVLFVTLNNGPLNLVSLQLTRELAAAIERAESDSGVRAVVVTGAGSKAFCAGSDVGEFPSYISSERVVEDKLRFENETYSRLASLSKPTVAALNGLAYGGGLELALCCDLIIAEESVRFCLPEIKLGVFPGSGGTVRLVRRVGEGRAKEMIFLGEAIGAGTAFDWGLINAVVPDGSALERSRELGFKLSGGAAKAMSVCKEVMRVSRDIGEERAVEAVLAGSDIVFSGAECKEGVEAFLNKRAPVFFGRE